MALHTTLPIYKVAYGLFDLGVDLAKNMPRDFKQSIGGKLRDECIEIMVLIFRANTAKEKAPHLGILREQIAARVTEPWWLWLAETILFHDPRQNFELRGMPALFDLVPPHKRLASQPAHLGLPIGNLSSQFFANIYLDTLDQFAKHQLRARHYIRYVDDFVLLHESPQWLNAAHDEIEAFLPRQLNARLNPKKTILQPLHRGVDFVGHVIKPWHRSTRKRTVNEAVRKMATTPGEDLFEVANSYFGLLRQAQHSHHDRARLANALRRRGHCINGLLTKTYRRSV